MISDFAVSCTMPNVLYGYLIEDINFVFGLADILSVLRTAGATKRVNLAENEEVLLYRTLRDMNLSKLIAQDVPLFLSMLQDLFPLVSSPAKNVFLELEQAIGEAVENASLIGHPTWLAKVVQLHETCLVRHGIMVVGPAAGGKSRIIEILQAALTKTTGTQHRIQRLNPKAVTSQELFGQTDPQVCEKMSIVPTNRTTLVSFKTRIAVWGVGDRRVRICLAKVQQPLSAIQHLDYMRRASGHAMD